MCVENSPDLLVRLSNSSGELGGQYPLEGSCIIYTIIPRAGI